MTIVCIISVVMLLLTDVLFPVIILRSNNVRFTKQSLQNDEDMQKVAKTHWIVMVYTVIIQIIITALCVMLLTFRAVEISGNGWIPIACVLAVLFWLLGKLWNHILHWCREYVVTNKRVLIKYGILSRVTREFRIEKVESCDVRQGVIGRVLGYGTIIIRGVGGSGDTESYVKYPFKFRQFIIDIIANEKKDSNGIISQPLTTQYDTISELQAYKKLFDDGVITKDEFDKKKQDILERK